MPSSVRANLGRDDLIASYYTICGTMPFESSRFSFAERATAAARAGFSAIGLIIKDFLVCRRGYRSRRCEAFSTITAWRLRKSN